ncbi:monosaccharide ABC transporter membrane protein (CUT2 family) [Halanaerobium saccharolyticum]|uniref:Monosaccharide ABC transporter membrane protein (CUT2 family) n=1 Tax=Halanaerobium saccharolyticum TaxID=43595 RepID=A0A4R7YU42_9FIRM|nr:ABC transporter permease [Halanaerobium saccharolyticum]RAK06337.1 monosaccharide ABC transporter membrane protein (CUT2 family) [Halanaerobium saccharolyticum]TDW00649.1 monosaccharide ABC transporter membrane protein (CUT2 family) [Halanaerobium saccharolyticum]TDX52262.1 monosaccharide ABC transporter membrane protein (CUT2 family) [Halanaerobium saccharolyticum]
MAEKSSENRMSLERIQQIREFSLIGFIIILSIFVQFRNSNFLTMANLDDLLTNTAILSILAVGMMMVIITRGIDLSIGATLALSGMLTSMLVSVYPALHPLAALLIGTLIGFVSGSIIGLLVAKFNILPIIATLGMMNVFRGITFLISGGKWVSAYQMSDSFKSISTGSILGINNLIVISIFIYLVFYYFINYTRTGRKIYAVGSSPKSAKVSGINVTKITWLVYSIMGSLAGLSGVLWVSKFASAQSNTASGYELNVIAACVIGGISIAGGEGKVTGLLSGVLLYGILENALPMINVSPFWQNAIQGAVILIAVVVSALIKRKTGSSNKIRRED